MTARRNGNGTARPSGAGRDYRKPHPGNAAAAALDVLVSDNAVGPDNAVPFDRLAELTGYTFDEIEWAVDGALIGGMFLVTIKRGDLGNREGVYFAAGDDVVKLAEKHREVAKRWARKAEDLDRIVARIRQAEKHERKIFDMTIGRYRPASRDVDGNGRRRAANVDSRNCAGSGKPPRAPIFKEGSR